LGIQEGSATLIQLEPNSILFLQLGLLGNVTRVHTIAMEKKNY